MAFFFRPAVAPALTDALLTALNEQPPANNNQAQQRAAVLSQTVQIPPRQLNGWSVTIALLFLVALFFASVYTAFHVELEDLHKILIQALSVMLGLVPGAVLGESGR
jgi:hypothetical protein